MMRPDDRWVRWLLVPAIVFISQATNDAYLVDFWHHLARGREMTRTGQLLDHDIFTFTVPNTIFLDVNWLTQIAYADLYAFGGLGLVRTVNALFLAGAWAWLVGICKRESGSLEIAMAVGLATFLGCWQVLTIRPQTMSIVLFIGMYDVLLRAERDCRWLFLTPLFLALWANVHGAFPAGLMLIGMFTAGRIATLVLSPLPRYSGGEGPGVRGAEPAKNVGTAVGENPPSPQPTSPGVPGGEGAKTRRVILQSLATIAVWAAASAACAAATLLNPYTWEIYVYARNTSGIAAERGIDEWLPPSWDQGIGVAFFLSLPIVLGLLGRTWRKGVWREACLLFCFGYLAATSIRMVLWWLIVIAPMISIRLADLWPKSRMVTYKPSRAAAFTVAGLLAVCVLSMPPLHGINPLLKLRSPDETMANLDKALKLIASRADKGRIFTKLEWGEYLGWRGYPNWKINMDGRIEIYPRTVWEEYYHTTRGIYDHSGFSGSQTFGYFVLDDHFHRRTGLLDRVENAKTWRKLEQFGQVVVFVKVDAGNAKK